MKAKKLNKSTMQLEEIEVQILPKIITELFHGPAFPAFSCNEGIVMLRYEREIDGLFVCSTSNYETVIKLAAEEARAIYYDAITTASAAAIKLQTDVYNELQKLDPPWHK